MSIQKVSMANSLRDVPFEAGMKVAGMAMSNQKQQGEAVMNLLNASQIIKDPALGKTVDILA